ncbi:hypothetical protein [Zavarzinella formosa]|uniref:hypothetical protein n=1 Tax=Zavarzinella formosa TaxID=360055 RepID=UPI0002D39D1F|nr:hypothetical protein [Zavarzinella formosa]
MSSESDPPLFENRWAKEAAANTVLRPFCQCLDPQYDGDPAWLDDPDDNDLADDEQVGNSRWNELTLHTEVQDTSRPGWVRLLELIEQAASDQREEFSPGREMTPEQWTQIVTLPPSIAKLKSVKHLILYGSSLVRIPPEIGEMTSLEQFTPYTSYRLHWFPYQITRCANLRRSTVSTRALYGNYKYRPPFPKLPQLHEANTPARCSLCDAPFGESAPMQYWVSLGVGTDVLPLLVHACSQRCLSMIRTPPKDYVQFPHQGGLELAQPAPW